MSSVYFRLSARQDLCDIEEFIAEDNPTAAVDFVAMLKRKCGLLGENPHMGKSRPDLASDLRMFPVREYLVFYKPLDSGADIFHIVHASRDIDALYFD